MMLWKCCTQYASKFGKPSSGHSTGKGQFLFQFQRKAMKTDLFQSYGHCWVFQICWYIECSTLTASSFSIWNSLHAISSSPLSLFIAMLPKANFTLQNVWLCVSDHTIMVIQVIRPFLYSSVYSCHLFLISPASVKSFLFLPLMCPYFHEMFSWYRQYSWRDS